MSGLSSVPNGHRFTVNIKPCEPNSPASAIEHRADADSDSGFARLCFVQRCPKGHTKVLKLSAGLRTHPAECSKLGKTQIIADAKRGVVRNAGFCGQIYRRLLHLELIPASAPIINLLPLCQPFLCQFFFPSVTESVCSSYCPLEAL